MGNNEILYFAKHEITKILYFVIFERKKRMAKFCEMIIESGGILFRDEIKKSVSWNSYFTIFETEKAENTVLKKSGKFAKLLFVRL